MTAIAYVKALACTHCGRPTPYRLEMDAGRVFVCCGRFECEVAVKAGRRPSAVITTVTRDVYRTPGGKSFLSKRAVYARHAWDLIRAKHSRQGEACTCGPGGRYFDGSGDMPPDDRCFYHLRSGYPESSRNASPVEKLNHRLTRWLVWRDRRTRA